jgi:hypothetical protein
MVTKSTYEILHFTNPMPRLKAEVCGRCRIIIIATMKKTSWLLANHPKRGPMLPNSDRNKKI